MAYVAHHEDFPAAASYRPLPLSQPARPRRGFWRTLYDAIMQAHQRDAQRTVEEFVARRGKLTDSIEREIADRLIKNRF